MVPEAAEAVDGGQHDCPQAQVPAEEGGDKGEVHRVVPAPGLSGGRCVHQDAKMQQPVAEHQPHPGLEHPEGGLVGDPDLDDEHQGDQEGGQHEQGVRAALQGALVLNVVHHQQHQHAEGQRLGRSLQFHVLARLTRLAHDVHHAAEEEEPVHGDVLPGVLEDKRPLRVLPVHHHHPVCSRRVEELGQDSDQGEDHLHHGFPRNQLPPPVPSLVSRRQRGFEEPLSPQQSQGHQHRVVECYDEEQQRCDQVSPEGPHGPGVCGRATGWRRAATSRARLPSKSGRL